MSDPYITAPARGRARSESVHEGTDEDLLADLDVLNGVEGATSTRRRPPRENTAAPPAPGALSRKTVAMLSDLEAASRATPPELEFSTERVLTEEELAEAELAEAERRRRQAGESSSGGGGGGGRRDGAAPAAAGSLSSSAAVSGGLGAGAGAASGAGASARREKPGEKFDVLVKLLLLGDSGVGKTSLLTRYAEDRFSTSLLSTAGVDYKTQMLRVGSATVKCQIWDTAGQQRFHVITQAYYRGAGGIALVYDASDPSEESFNNVRYWLANIAKHASAGVAIMLLGNKCDAKGAAKKVRGVASSFQPWPEHTPSRTRAAILATRARPTRHSL